MNSQRKDDHEDIELLLPWHAAGTLSRRDAARVEQALANDNELARRYEAVREELGETIHLNESLGAPSARAADKLFAMIDAEPARKPKASLNVGAWLADFIAGFSPRTLAYTAGAAGLAIVLQAGILAGLFIKEQQGVTQLASYEQAETVAQGAFVLVRFSPQASAESITKFLQDNNAAVVGGPGSSGMFRLRVSESAMTQADLSSLVRRFGQDPVVGMALPVSN